MEKAKKQERTIHSLEEFRKMYLPKQPIRGIIETPEEARDFGVNLADESMKNVKITSLE